MEISCPGEQVLDLDINGLVDTVAIVQGKAVLTLSTEVAGVYVIQPADRRLFCPAGEGKLKHRGELMSKVSKQNGKYILEPDPKLTAILKSEEDLAKVQEALTEKVLREILERVLLRLAALENG